MEFVKLLEKQIDEAITDFYDLTDRHYEECRRNNGEDFNEETYLANYENQAGYIRALRDVLIDYCKLHSLPIKEEWYEAP